MHGAEFAAVSGWAQEWETAPELDNQAHDEEGVSSTDSLETGASPLPTSVERGQK